MTIPALPSLDRTSATFKTDLDAFFLTQLPATIPAFNAEIERINAIGFGSYNATSSSSLTIGAGSKSLTIEAGKSFAIGQPVMIASTASPTTAYMSGQVVSYDAVTGALVVNVIDIAGSGTLASWSVSASAQVLKPTRIGDVFQGAVKPTAGTWLPLAGATYLQSSYAELYGLIGLLPDNIAAVQTAIARTLPSSGEWYSVAYGGGMFVAIAQGGTAAASSPDGTTWTARTMPSSSNWSAVTYGGGKFVAVASSGTAAAYSADGITWTASTLPSSATWVSVAYGNGVFVAVASGGTQAATSTNGTTWIGRTTTAGNWNSVTFGGGVFVAVSLGTAQAAYSADGISWTASTLPSSGSWRTVAYGNGIFVAVMQSSATAATSPDGITWTTRTLPSSAAWIGLAFGGGLFYATVNSSTVAATSPDGITWTTRTLPSSASWFAVAYGNGVFVTTAGGPSTSAASAGPVITYNAATQFYLPLAATTPGINQWIRGL